MSKFFNETWQTKNPAPRTRPPDASVIRQLVEGVKGSNAAAGDLLHVRLSRCHKIRIPPSANLPFLAESEDVMETAMEAYRTLRTRLMRIKAGAGLRSVVMTSAVSEEGKTLTTLNLGLCCAQLSDHQVLLIDGDLRTKGLTRKLGSAGHPGLYEVLKQECSLEESILSTNVPNLYVLGAGCVSSSPSELFTGRRWQEVIGWCAETFSLVLVDAPPILALADFELITAACDGVLMVVRALHTKRELLEKATERIDAKKLIGVVYNAAQEGYRSQPYARAYAEQVKEK